MIRRAAITSSVYSIRFVSIRPAKITAQTLNCAAPLFLLHTRMRDYSQHTITSEAFDKMAEECGVANAEEAKANLQEAGYVVDFGSYIHLRPALLMQQTTGWSVASGAEVEAKALAKALQKAQVELAQPLKRLYKRQRFVWACALAFVGLQGCIIANLTFTEDGYGWDVMEPVSYFLGCYTSLLFFLFMLRYRKEHSYVEFDKKVLAPKLRSRFAPNFNWKEYDALCQKFREQELSVTRMNAWMKRN